MKERRVELVEIYEVKKSYRYLKMCIMIGKKNKKKFIEFKNILF
jgi:hypothetical protein